MLLDGYAGLSYGSGKDQEICGGTDTGEGSIKVLSAMFFLCYHGSVRRNRDM